MNGFLDQWVRRLEQSASGFGDAITEPHILSATHDQVDIVMEILELRNSAPALSDFDKSRANLVANALSDATTRWRTMESKLLAAVKAAS